jgi:hypothetical protein
MGLIKNFDVVQDLLGLLATLSEKSINQLSDVRAHQFDD